MIRGFIVKLDQVEFSPRFVVEIKTKFDVVLKFHQVKIVEAKPNDPVSGVLALNFPYRQIAVHVAFVDQGDSTDNIKRKKLPRGRVFRSNS